MIQHISVDPKIFRMHHTIASCSFPHEATAETWSLLYPCHAQMAKKIAHVMAACNTQIAYSSGESTMDAPGTCFASCRIRVDNRSWQTIVPRHKWKYRSCSHAFFLMGWNDTTKIVIYLVVEQLLLMTTIQMRRSLRTTMNASDVYF